MRGSKRALGPWALIGAAIVAVCIFVVFRSALNAEFVFDDHPRIVEAEKELDTIWPPDWIGGGQRPAVRFSLAVNHAFGGLDPWGYHLFNVLLHSIAGGVAFLVVVAGSRRLAERGVASPSEAGIAGLALAVSLVWACHPVQTASATYVIQRAESMAALFSLLAILTLLLSGHGLARTFSICCFVGLALVSKPVAVVLPAALLLVDRYVIAGDWRSVLVDRRTLHLASWACLSVLLLTDAVQALFRSDGLSGAGFVGTGVSSLDYLTAQISAVGVYARVLFDPGAMSIDHGFEALEPTWTWVVGSAVIVGTLVALVLGARRNAWWTVLPSTIVLAMLPTTSVVPLADPVADHRIYLATLPLVLGVGVAVAAAIRRLPASRRRAGIGVALLLTGAVLVAEAIAVDRRNADYAEPRVLWDVVTERRPDHVRGRVNRAAVALAEGRVDDASRDLLVASRIQPGNPVVLMNLALIDLQEARPEAALEKLAIARLARDDDPVLHAARGDALRDVGRPELAAEAYARSIQLQPGDVPTRIARGNALAACERLDAAAIEFARAAELADDVGLRASARFNEGNMRFIQGRMADAVLAYEAALIADPGHGEARRWLEEAKRHDD